MKIITTTVILLFALIGCKKEDTYIDPRDEHLGTYSCNLTSSSPDPSSTTGEITVSKTDIYQLYFDFANSTPHLRLKGAMGSNNEFGIDVQQVQTNNNRTMTFSGSGRFTNKGISFNLVADFNDGKTQRGIILITGFQKP